MTRILLIVPRFTTSRGEYYDFPIGLAYISAVLKRAGHRVAVLNLNHHEDRPAAAVIEEWVRDWAPAAVCSGGLTAHFHQVREIVQATRDTNAAVKIVLGGGLVTSEPEMMCRALNPDYIVVGEGEQTAVELFAALESGGDIRHIRGVGFLNPFGYQFTGERESIDDLDSLPLPDYEGFGIEEFFSRQSPASNYLFYAEDEPRVLPLITSRSCPLHCTFCFHPLGQKYRMRSLEKVVEEVRMLVARYRLNILLIVDEMMSASKKRLLAFSEAIEPLGIRWVCQLSPRIAEPELLAKMRRSGCYYISYGLESASDTVLRSMRKSMNPEQMARGLRLTAEAGIGIQGNFIFGDPAENRETVEETLQWWREHLDYHINLGLIVPYPGSPDYVQAVERGLIRDPLAWIEAGCPVVNLSQMEDHDFQSLCRELVELTTTHRRFGQVVDTTHLRHDEVKGVALYELSVRCPQCGETTTYRNFHLPGGAYFKWACRNCNQRFDLSWGDFPHVSRRIGAMREQLGEVLAGRASLALTPRISEQHCAEYLHLAGLDPAVIELVGMLDGGAVEEGERYLGRIPVLNRRHALSRGGGGADFILILPSRHQHEIHRELCRELAVDPARVVIYPGEAEGDHGQ